MGMATYHLKARFAKPITDELLERINVFRQQGEEAYDYWQKHRGEQTTAQILTTFRMTWPLVRKYLGNHTLNDTNDFAGLLDFGRKADDEVFDMRADDDYVLTFTAYVWHFADWSLLASFLESEFGATKVDWLSDEYADIGNLLQV